MVVRRWFSFLVKRQCRPAVFPTIILIHRARFGKILFLSSASVVIPRRVNIFPIKNAYLKKKKKVKGEWWEKRRNSSWNWYLPGWLSSSSSSFRTRGKEEKRAKSELITSLFVDFRSPEQRRWDEIKATFLSLPFCTDAHFGRRGQGIGRERFIREHEKIMDPFLERSASLVNLTRLIDLCSSGFALIVKPGK